MNRLDNLKKRGDRHDLRGALLDGVASLSGRTLLGALWQADLVFVPPDNTLRADMPWR